MPSPFPGMNPYLEQEDAWHDFHERFMPAAAEPIAAQVDPRYIVKIDEGYLPTVDLESLSFLEIRDRRNRQSVTVIELLSPSNKRSGSDRDQYLAKRQLLLNSSVHLVEIDLLRGGTRPPIENLPTCHYCIMVSRAEIRPRAELWPLSLQDRLPTIPIPLRPPDPDVALDIQAVLHPIYDRARYRTYVYDGEPEPSLSPEEADWARQFVPPQTEEPA